MASTGARMTVEEVRPMVTEDPSANDDDRVVTSRIGADDVDRLDRIASRRGIGRSELIAEAIDEFLAHEGLSGRFITPPPPMRIPPRFRDRTRSRRKARLRTR